MAENNSFPTNNNSGPKFTGSKSLAEKLAKRRAEMEARNNNNNTNIIAPTPPVKQETPPTPPTYETPKAPINPPNPPVYETSKVPPIPPISEERESSNNSSNQNTKAEEPPKENLDKKEEKEEKQDKEDKNSFAAKFGKRSALPSQNNSQNEAKKSKIEELLEQKEKNKSMSMTSQALDNKSDPTTHSQADLVYLVKGIDDGRNAWYYVLVERLKLSMFQKALNDDIIHLENYGKILYSAYGDEPPQDITDKLKAEYGIK